MGNEIEKGQLIEENSTQLDSEARSEMVRPGLVI
ncbi:hypothetical protein VT84_38100 [Gemmata sp. SH-PL17]|nr:hypothetical protein VT84_38100 [Gemmata sp. SH-PL17]